MKYFKPHSNSLARLKYLYPFCYVPVLFCFLVPCLRSLFSFPFVTFIRLNRAGDWQEHLNQMCPSLKGKNGFPSVPDNPTCYGLCHYQNYVSCGFPLWMYCPVTGIVLLGHRIVCHNFSRQTYSPPWPHSTPPRLPAGCGQLGLYLVWYCQLLQEFHGPK